MWNFNALRQGFRRALADEAGFVSLYFAQASAVLVLAVGIGLDLARMNAARQILQQSLDSAAMAAVVAAQREGADMTDTASFDPTLNANLDANLDAEATGASVAMRPSVALAISGNVLTIDARIDIEAGFTRLAGYKTLTVSVASHVLVPQDASQNARLIPG